MPQIKYRAFKSNGEEVIGRLEATEISAAIEILHQQGLTPYEINHEKTDAQEWWNIDILGGEKLNRNEVAILSRELATLVSAELPIDEALQSIADQKNSKAGKHAIKIKQAIQEGISFTKALENQNIFSPSQLSIIQAGELGGTLNEALSQVAEFSERENKLINDIQSALFYPAILLALASAAVVFILTVLLPSLKPIFDDANASLPASTAFLIQLGTLLKTNWLLLLIFSFSVLLAVIYALKNPNIQARTDHLILKTPLIGPIVLKSQTALLNRTLGVLIKNGVNITKALNIVEDVVSNHKFKLTVNNMKDKIKEGESFIQCYEQSNIFPLLATRLAAAGDRTGKLDMMLLRTADIFEDQVKRDIDRLVGLLTPILTVSIGLLVGGLVVSVLTAILSVNDLAF